MPYLSTVRHVSHLTKKTQFMAALLYCLLHTLTSPLGLLGPGTWHTECTASLSWSFSTTSFLWATTCPPSAVATVTVRSLEKYSTSGLVRQNRHSIPICSRCSTYRRMCQTVVAHLTARCVSFGISFTMCDKHLAKPVCSVLGSIGLFRKVSTQAQFQYTV